jgi:carbamoyltransferase
MAVILGINAFHAGASAALLIDGIPVAAIAEERLNRVKYYGGFPKLAIPQCLQIAGLTFKDVDYLAVGRNPLSNRRKKVEYTLKNPSKLLNIRKIKAARNRLDDIKTLLVAECDIPPDQLNYQQVNVEHHLAHIASAYFMSPWEHCAGFSMDGSGDFVTVCLLSVKERISESNNVCMYPIP